jgi:hypothetical protein
MLSREPTDCPDVNCELQVVALSAGRTGTEPQSLRGVRWGIGEMVGEWDVVA